MEGRKAGTECIFLLSTWISGNTIRGLIWCWKHANFPHMSAAVIPSPGTLKAYCKAHAIARLRLFGSAAREDFDPGRSDVDLLVEYEPGRHPGLDHFQIAEELSGMFGRKVDLNTPAMMGRQLPKVLQEARLLYGHA